MYQSLIASTRISPVHALLAHMLSLSTPLGILIAAGELSIGIGVLLGFWTRIAAAGGLLLSFTLFLTVSFHSSPYFTGADIVFCFAWLPFIVAGAGGVFSLDAFIATRTRATAKVGPATPVALTFATVQSLCGNYDNGTCAARKGKSCKATQCPVIHEQLPKGAAVSEADLRRRAVVMGGVAAGVIGVGAAALGGISAALGRAVGAAKTTATRSHIGFGGSTSTTSPHATTTTSPHATTTTTLQSPTTTSTTKIPGVAIGKITQVAVGQAAQFTDPASKQPALAIRLKATELVAFTRVCPHAGCTCSYSSSAHLIVCPCHGSEFNQTTGAVVRGPATKGLTRIPVEISSTGIIYVDG